MKKKEYYWHKEKYKYWRNHDSVMCKIYVSTHSDYT